MCLFVFAISVFMNVVYLIALLTSSALSPSHVAIKEAVELKWKDDYSL